MRAKGRTWAEPDYDRPAREVEGELEVRRLPTHDQYLIGGLPVEPATVRPLDDAARAAIAAKPDGRAADGQ